MIERRRFIRTAGTVLTTAPVGALWAQRQPDCADSPCTAGCGPTRAATEGPYYVRNVGAATDINKRGASGKPMRITGVVLGGANGKTPLANVRVEIWHCDTEGHHHPNGNGDVSRYKPAQVNLRGLSTTDAKGQFAFDSIVPGIYGTRRRHLHWRFEAAGHQAVTTQTYWQSEKGGLRDRTDFADRDVEACRWLAFTTNPRGVEEAVFTVALKTLA
ncbi:MAG: hypothetical protein ACK4OE_19290 [Acidovorax sp.]|uniref:dioxygenase family protein n=1 Tax=Acidovorax sp. TaxID=1872122 RepID=UPI00391A67D3